MAGQVEVGGELSRGATLFDQRSNRQWPNNMEVARLVDVTAVKQAVLRYLDPQLGF